MNGWENSIFHNNYNIVREKVNMYILFLMTQIKH